MTIDQIQLYPSPDAPNQVRLAARVTSDQTAERTSVYWYDVPERLAHQVDISGNPWAVAMLPLAMTWGEPLRIETTVDSVLQAGLLEVARIFHCWYPELKVVAVEAPSLPPSRPTNTACGVFFSGGVDSWHTVLDCHPDCLVTVHGFDIPLDRTDAFARMLTTMLLAAKSVDADLIPVTTNLRSGAWRRLPWGKLAHGCGLASIGHVLSGHLRRIVIASSYGYGDLRPWASHVLTDPLLSSQSLRVEHHGAASSRVEKTRLVASSPVALQSLRVCWVGRDDRNCGQCEKCVRTMATLELLGVLKQCPAFAADHVTADVVCRLDMSESSTVSFWGEVRTLAAQVNRQDMVKAIDQRIAQSARRERWRTQWANLRAAFRRPLTSRRTADVV